MKRLGIVFALSAFISLTVQAQSLKVFDLYHDLDQEIATSGQLNESTFEKYEARHLERLKSVLYLGQSEQFGPFYWQEAILNFTNEYPSQKKESDQYRLRATSGLEKAFEFFKNKLSLRPKAELKAYLLPTLMTFNGAVFDQSDVPEDQDEPVLYLGIDTLLARKDNPAYVAAHETVHLVHFHLKKGKDLYQSLTSPLWIEGLAISGSHLVYPEQSLEQLLSDPKLAVACRAPQQVSKMASEFLSVAKISYDDVDQYDQAFRRWFFISKDRELNREAYCLGYRVTEHLLKKQTWKTLLSWEHRKFQRETLKVLELLKKSEIAFGQ